MKSSQVISAKFLLRRRLRNVLSRLSRTEARRKSLKIMEKLIRSEAFKNARTLFAYMALPGEVQTKTIVSKAIRLGKRVYAPRIDAAKKKITIFEIREPSADLHPGAFGIPEPRAKKDRQGRPSSLDLVIVPGLGFDRKGRRLGRGEGYFDRFLKKTGKAVKIGIAFREQIVKKIPTAAHDVRVDKILTD